MLVNFLKLIIHAHNYEKCNSIDQNLNLFSKNYQFESHKPQSY